MSVRHHEQLFSHQQREQQLMNSLAESADALANAIRIIEINLGPQAVPAEILKTSMKYGAPRSGLEAITN